MLQELLSLVQVMVLKSQVQVLLVPFGSNTSVPVNSLLKLQSLAIQQVTGIILIQLQASFVVTTEQRGLI